MKLNFFRKKRQNIKKPIRKIVISINPLIIKNLKCEMRNAKLKKGFSLVELIVSVAITGILMVGISAFFSSTFRNLFEAQNRAANTQRQFAVNEIIRKKFTTLNSLVEDDTNYILSFNEQVKDQLPFSYIGKDPENHLVFKDVMIFNKIADSDVGQIYGSSGDGIIYKAGNGDLAKSLTSLKNFAGFEKVGTTYYVATPHKNTVMECNGSCAPLNLDSQLLSPTDVVYGEIEVEPNTFKEFLFISDSENGRIIKYDLDAGQEDLQPIATGLKYPTGLAFYDDGVSQWLFVAETFAHQIRKINLTTPSAIPVVVGEGDDSTCDQVTAKFCKLNLPTGLFVFIDESGPTPKPELYIADSGNNRILKVSDPGIPENLRFEFTPGNNYALDRIEFVNANWTNEGSYNETESNLIGYDTHYNSKTFLNPDRLTTFANGSCGSGTNHFYVNEDTSAIGLQNGHKLIIEGSIYTIKNINPKQECRLLPEDPSLKKAQIIVSETASGITAGQTVYLTNPDDVIVQLDGIDMNGSGFQTFEIKTYDVIAGLVKTNYHAERIGDGIVGTEEDMIEVVAKDLNFPTGVSNAYYANSGEKKIRRMDGTNDKNLNPIDITEFTSFDYVSDFTLDPVSPLEFNKYNCPTPDTCKILELTINAQVDENNVQTYILNAALP